jgi:hypothetical protein
VSTPCAIGDQTIWLTPSRAQSGTTSPSMTRQSIEYCGWLLTRRSKPISSAIFSAASISEAFHSLTPT